jgi:hypothetical protein
MGVTGAACVACRKIHGIRFDNRRRMANALVAIGHRKRVCSLGITYQGTLLTYIFCSLDAHPQCPTQLCLADRPRAKAAKKVIVFEGKAFNIRQLFVV